MADEQHGGVELRLERATRSRTSASTVASSPVVGSSRMSRADPSQRHRDHDALLHPAGELVGVAVHHARGIGDLHRRGCSTARSDASRRKRARERFGDLRADLHPSGSRLRRGSVDHRDRACVGLAQPRLPSASTSSPATETGLPDAAVAGQVTHDRRRRGGLPAPGLADQPVRAPALDRDDMPRSTGRSTPRTRYASSRSETSRVFVASALIARTPRGCRRRRG